MLFFLVPILFLELFYLPVWNKDGIYRNIKNIIYFGLPFFVFGSSSFGCSNSYAVFLEL